MVCRQNDKWMWDSWYVRDGSTYHMFFLQASKDLPDPDMRHFNVSQGHAVSTDLINWQHLGTCLEPSAEPAWDDKTTWTGSVVKDDDGLWHLFYTGARSSEEGLKQRIGHATSEDLHNWTRVGDGLCLDITRDDYEDYVPGHWHDRAFRDPWVMRDPNGEGWCMYFTARSAGIEEANAAGALGYATSPDLVEWTLQAPLLVGCAGQLEVPQVFEKNGQWYCLFCNIHEHWSKAYRAGYPGAPVSGTHYLIADSHLGPWQIAPGPYLDGSDPNARYAARLLDTDTDDMKLIGFANTPNGDFVGEITNPDPVVIEDGMLCLRPTGIAVE